MEIKSVTMTKEDIEKMDEEQFKEELVKALGLPEDANIEFGSIEDVIGKASDEIVESLIESCITIIKAEVTFCEEGVISRVGCPEMSMKVFSNLEGFSEAYKKAADKLSEATDEFGKRLAEIIKEAPVPEEEEE